MCCDWGICEGSPYTKLGLNGLQSCNSRQDKHKSQFKQAKNVKLSFGNDLEEGIIEKGCPF